MHTKNTAANYINYVLLYVTRQLFMAGLGTWPFCCQFVKVWPELVWPQIFCLAFWSSLRIFEKLAEFQPNLYMIPHSRI